MNNNKHKFFYLFPTLIGKNIIIFITSIGNITSFLIYALQKAIIPPFYIKEYFKQIYLNVNFLFLNRMSKKLLSNARGNLI